MCLTETKIGSNMNENEKETVTENVQLKKD